MRKIGLTPLLLMAMVPAFLTGCKTPAAHKPGTALKRSGDEIVVCGQYFHVGAPVVLWTDPGGYDAYRVERRFVPYEDSSYAATTQKTRDIDSPARYNLRFAPRRPTTRRASMMASTATSSATTQSVVAAAQPSELLTPEQLEQVRGGGWPLELLQDKVDQFVYHYDVCGTSRRCFQVLQDMRGLSVHFMLDIDGTIYQTLDLKERAWHGGTANSRSVGIEIANIGAYPINSSPAILKQWYKRDEKGGTYITIPDNLIKQLGDPPVRVPGTYRPARPDPVYGKIQGTNYRQYDLTPQQYESLTKLTAALCTVFPKMKCDYPRDERGQLITHALTLEEQEKYSGLMGHYHVIESKQDPGPAFQWDRVVNGARKLIGSQRPPTTQPMLAEVPLK